MNTILAMTWDELQTTVLGGIIVAGVVIPALIAFIIRMIPQIAQLKAALETLKERTDRNDVKIEKTADTLTQVALQTPTNVADAVTMESIRKAVEKLTSNEQEPKQ